MLNWLINKRLDAFERSFDYDVSYMRDMAAASRKGFLRFSRLLDLSAHRENAPLGAWYAAKLVSTLSEDCGPCTQLVTTMAEREGVAPETLRAILRGDEAVMNDDTRLAYRYARAVMAHDPAADALRAEVVARWGRAGLVTLALALAISRVYPTLKYALGYGKTCVRVRVAGSDTVPRSALSRATATA